MPKVSGIDFSSLKHYRNAVTVKLFDGEEVTLPLIKVRDSGIASTLLQRNDVLSVQFNTIQARLHMKQASVGSLASSISSDENATEELITERGYDALDDAMELVGNMQKKLIALSHEHNKLYDEIHEFLTPYLEGTNVLAQLNEVEPVYTIKVLKLMLEGEEALMPITDEGSAEENPTTAPSQKS